MSPVSQFPGPLSPPEAPRLVVSWALVAVLLGYGVIQTLVTAAKLFTH